MELELADITQEIYDITKRLDKASKEIIKMGSKAAHAEFEYRKALAEEIIKLKAEKMPATLIGDLARGKVAELKLKRDLSEKLWTSYKLSIGAIEAQQMGLQSILKRQDEV